MTWRRMTSLRQIEANRLNARLSTGRVLVLRRGDSPRYRVADVQQMLDEFVSGSGLA